MLSLKDYGNEEIQRYYDKLMLEDKVFCHICNQEKSIKNAIQTWRNGNLIHVSCDDCSSLMDLYIFKRDSGIYVAGRRKP